MKVRMRKKMLEKAGVFYVNEISREFLNRPLTPAAIVSAQYRLNMLRYRQQELEPMNTIWSVPFVVKKLNERDLVVEPDEDFLRDNVLFIDWP